MTLDDIHVFVALAFQFVIAALVLRVWVFVRRVETEWDYHHELLAPVRTIAGLVDALALALEAGGLDPAQRAAIYAAIREQIMVFEQTAMAKRGT